MFQHLPSLKALHIFEAAARHGSFVEAAQELKVSPGAVSYQIKQLEASLATPLFVRKTRQVVLTPGGEALFRTVHRQLQELDSTIAQFAPDRSAQTLTVSVSTYFVTRWLSPRMGRFLTAHPDIVIRLQHSVNDPDFRVEDTDVAIKWGDGHKVDGCRVDGPGSDVTGSDATGSDGHGTGSFSELLLALPMIAVCSPALLQGPAVLQSVEDLRQHTLLRDQGEVDRWCEWLVLAGTTDISVNGPVIVDPNVRVQSAVDGHGIVLANPLVQPLIDDGRLCEPFATRLNGYGYYLVYSERVSNKPAFREFRSWLQSETTL
jgi:LysR family glycine cleavage system transcriptional activator